VVCTSPIGVVEELGDDAVESELLVDGQSVKGPEHGIDHLHERATGVHPLVSDSREQIETLEVVVARVALVIEGAGDACIGVNGETTCAGSDNLVAFLDLLLLATR